MVFIYESPSIPTQQPQYAHPIHHFSIDTIFAAKVETISFSPKSPSCEPRILLASPTTVHIFSALPESPSFHASILNAASPSISLQSAIFLTANEVLLVPELAPRITIRGLVTGLGVELRDVKHTSLIRKVGNRVSSYSIRENSGHVAFLTRPSAGKDVVVILSQQQDRDNGTRTVEIEFPIATSDAVGLRFSPDGAWLAIWDIPSAGISQDPTNSSTRSTLYIYTSTGNLYKQWNDMNGSQNPELGLGVERIEWIADGRLVIGTFDGRTVILAARTFEEECVIQHPTIFDSIPKTASIFVEEIAQVDSTRTYSLATLPAAPPSGSTSSSSGNEISPRGIIHLAIASNDSFMASVSAHTPTTVHVTDLERGRVATRTILIHHASVKAIEWHPIYSAWLLIRTAQERSHDADIVHIWSKDLSEPTIIRASIPQGIKMKESLTGSLALTPRTGSNVTTSWITSPQDTHTNMIPHILFSFPNLGLSLPALGTERPYIHEELFIEPGDNETPTRQPSTSLNKFTQKTPIRGHGPEDAFDESFEQLRAESLAQSISESVTDGGFSPVKFDATDWTRRQILGNDDDEDDTFVGKGRRH